MTALSTASHHQSEALPSPALPANALAIRQGPSGALEVGIPTLRGELRWGGLKPTAELEIIRGLLFQRELAAQTPRIGSRAAPTQAMLEALGKALGGGFAARVTKLPQGASAQAEARAARRREARQTELNIHVERPMPKFGF